MILNKLLKSLGIGYANQFPLLTFKMLLAFRRKVNDGTITIEDCELIDHYLRTIGLEGYLEKLLSEDGISSFDEIENVYKYDDPHDPDDMTATNVSGSLLKCIRLLRQRIYRGEKIY
jgi:hypothetical protein